MKKIAVMVSGGGTNLQAIIDGVKNGSINAEIALVISSKEGVYALERAKNAGIPTKVIAKKAFETVEEFNKANLSALKECGADGVVLAGYMSIVSPEIVSQYENKIINIHPALIPSFCGMGYYGERVHKAVLEYGAKISGATVHFVNEQADNGPIIMQKSVPVLDGDTPQTLAARVLTVEHEILPKSVALFCDDKLMVDGRKVYIKGDEN